MSSFEKTEFGHLYKGRTFEAFFGNRRCGITELQTLFPELELQQKTQVHGNTIWEQDVSQEIEADALVTIRKNVALIVKTADCMPIVIASEDSDLIISIHAGWKGVANRILPTVIEKYQKRLMGHSWKVLIGPHILKNSFEVKSDVAKALTASATLGDRMMSQSQNGLFVDLKGLINLQCLEFSFFNYSLDFLEIDTLTSPEHCSYRREPLVPGRQLSFIFKKY